VRFVYKLCEHGSASHQVMMPVDPEEFTLSLANGHDLGKGSVLEKSNK
jgi:hypothetical protein